MCRSYLSGITIEELLELNDNHTSRTYRVTSRRLGGRKVVRLRQDDKSLPLTLLNDYTEFGHFDAETEKRDILQVENEIQTDQSTFTIRSYCMRSSEAVDRRTELPRKTVPKGGRVSAKTSRINRNASMRKSSAKKAGFRSNFELGVARSLANVEGAVRVRERQADVCAQSLEPTRPTSICRNRRCLSK